MSEEPNEPRGDLNARVHQKIRDDSAEGQPLVLAWLTVAVILVLGGGALWIEWSNIDLALRQLFPVLSDGSGYADLTSTLAFASVGAILFGDVLLLKASAHWSPRTERLVEFLGILALVAFVVSAMILLPSSIAQGSDPADGGAAAGAVSGWAYMSFAAMLAALFPISMLANFVLLHWLLPTLNKVERAKWREKHIANLRGMLAAREELVGKLHQVERDQAGVPREEEVADMCSADLSHMIGKAASDLHGIVNAREAAEQAQPGKPLKATDNDLLNHMPIELLRAQLEYLHRFSPAFVRQTLTTKEA